MKRTTVRSALAAAFSLGTMATADAVPLYFDFTGSIQDGTGTAVSGGFTLETNRFTGSLPNPAISSWVDYEPVSRADTVAHLSFGAQDFSFPGGPGTSFVVVNFFDGCTPAACSGTQFDNFGLFALAADREIVPGFTGSYTSRSFYVASAAIRYEPGSTVREAFDYFDATQVDLTSVVSLPLYDLIGFYSHTSYDCIEGACVANELSSSFSFTLDSVNRGMGARSVPEPGTLGLSAAGLLVALLMRRRRKLALAPRE